MNISLVRERRSCKNTIQLKCSDHPHNYQYTLIPKMATEKYWIRENEHVDGFIQKLHDV